MGNDYHRRNPAKHEYEIEPGSSRTAPMVFVGNTEKTAIRRATESLTEGLLEGEEHVRLYHSHPSPGPMRRYVGIIKPDGVLYRRVEDGSQATEQRRR